ncbi:MAG: hypothetical protein AAB472_02755 [Patescibacteria group bacterium]|mgnify:CR=1 FL=1
MKGTFGLTDEELKVFSKLTSAIKIQDFLDTLAINYEKEGETIMSPRRVLREKKAHCLEAALLASIAFRLQGEPGYLMECKTTRGDQHHAVTLYKRNGYWGAVSKTNHASLRFRDPIYKTIRELATSYFHEYFLNETGRKTFRFYTRPFSLRPFGTKWITSENDLWDIGYALQDAPHFPVIPEGNEEYIRNADALERKAGELTEWKESHPRT